MPLLAIIWCFLNFPVSILQRAWEFLKNCKQNSKENVGRKSSRIYFFKTYFIFQDLYPIKLHDLKLSSKDNYELTKKNEKRTKVKEKSQNLPNFCRIIVTYTIVYLLKLVSLELYHIGVIAFLFLTDPDFYFKKISCTYEGSKVFFMNNIFIYFL